MKCRLRFIGMVYAPFRSSCFAYADPCLVLLSFHWEALGQDLLQFHQRMFSPCALTNLRKQKDEVSTALAKRLQRLNKIALVFKAKHGRNCETQALHIFLVSYLLLCAVDHSFLLRAFSNTFFFCLKKDFVELFQFVKCLEPRLGGQIGSENERQVAGLPKVGAQP